MHFSIFDSIVSEAASVSLDKFIIIMYKDYVYTWCWDLMITFTDQMMDFIWSILYNPDSIAGKIQFKLI